MLNHPNRKKALEAFSPHALKSLRAATGWTQTECAAAIHSKLRTLQDWEAGIAAMHLGLWELVHIKAKRRRLEVAKIKAINFSEP
jgi:DNA-binding XRE family transcriptional regulator